MNYRQRFQVAPGSKVRLKDIDPAFKDARHESRKEAAEELEKDRKKLLELQELLYDRGGSRPIRRSDLPNIPRRPRPA